MQRFTGNLVQSPGGLSRIAAPSGSSRVLCTWTVFSVPPFLVTYSAMNHLLFYVPLIFPHLCMHGRNWQQQDTLDLASTCHFRLAVYRVTVHVTLFKSAAVPIH